MKNSLVIYICCLFISCGSGERVSKEVFEEVNRSMEVKKLSDAEIVQAAMLWGDSLQVEATESLMELLQDNDSIDGLEEIQAKAQMVSESMSASHSFPIKWIANQIDPGTSTEMEVQILETYRYDLENGIETHPSIQEVQSGEVFLYSKAVLISKDALQDSGSDSLKQANGEENKEVLAGMWAVYLPKKEVVKKM